MDAIKIDNPLIVDEAFEPYEPAVTKILLNTLLGLIIGLMAGAFFVLLREMMDKTVKEPKDIEEKVGLTVMGNIPIIVKMR